jgi:trimethylamine--corrinoid protein Co-methyltransferase
MGRSSYSVLDKDEAQRIHEAALSVLATIGLKVNSEAALNLLRESKCAIDARTRIVKIPESLVNWASKCAPKEFVLASRDGTRDIAVPAVDRPAICTDGFAVDVIDVDSGTRRKSTNEDLARGRRQEEGHPHIGSYGVPVG